MPFWRVSFYRLLEKQSYLAVIVRSLEKSFIFDLMTSTLQFFLKNHKYLRVWIKMHECMLSIVKGSKEAEFIIGYVRCLLFARQTLHPTAFSQEISLLHAVCISATTDLGLSFTVSYPDRRLEMWKGIKYRSLFSCIFYAGDLRLAMILESMWESVPWPSPHSVLLGSSKVSLVCPLRPKDGAPPLNTASHSTGYVCSWTPHPRNVNYHSISKSSPKLSS